MSDEDAIECRVRSWFNIAGTAPEARFPVDTHDEATMTPLERSQHRSAAAAANARRARY